MTGRQTHKGSAVEVATNLAVGQVINFTANMTILPLLFDLHPSAADAIWMGVVFTIISIARQYVLRRLFNSWHWGHK